MGKFWCSRIPKNVHGQMVVMGEDLAEVCTKTSVKDYCRKRFFPSLPSYHAPPQGISITGEARLPLLVHGILLRQVHKVGRKDEAKKANVQGGDKLLKNTVKTNILYESSYKYGPLCSIDLPVIGMQAKTVFKSIYGFKYE